MPSKPPLKQSHAQRRAVLANANVAREPVLNKPTPTLPKTKNVSWVMKMHKSVNHLLDSSKENSDCYWKVFGNHSVTEGRRQGKQEVTQFTYWRAFVSPTSHLRLLEKNKPLITGGVPWKRQTFPHLKHQLICFKAGACLVPGLCAHRAGAHAASAHRGFRGQTELLPGLTLNSARWRVSDRHVTTDYTTMSDCNSICWSYF